MYQAFNKLANQQKWSLKNQGICLAEDAGAPVACSVVTRWEAEGLKNLEATFQKTWTLKLVGPTPFLKAVSSYLKARGFNIAKEVERTGDFEVIHDGPAKKFKVSAAASVATSSVAAPTMAKAPVAATTAASTVVSPAPSGKIKVLIVDDSSTVRNLLQSMLKEDSSIEVIGALDLPSKVEPFILENRPDVITLDIHMPEMDGVQLLRQIQPKFEIPTIMISSLSQEDGPYVFDALEIGAFDYIKKPNFNEIASVKPVIIERIKMASAAGSKRKMKAPNKEVAAPAAKSQDKWDPSKLILIGSSTGGTEALKTLFTQFPDEIPPVLVVQHIPAVFSKALADRLNTCFKFTVKEAEDGDSVVPNQILIAPGGKQMEVRMRGNELKVVVNDDPPMNRHKPSVDYLFDSVAKLKKHSHMIAIILTGMGADGARGLKKLREIGAHTMAQDEESSVVYGMPKAAVEMGAAIEVVNLNRMGYYINRWMSGAAKKAA